MEMATCISSLAVVTGVSLYSAVRGGATCFSQFWSRYDSGINSSVLGYMVMPEHFHLLISEPQECSPSTVMQALKLGFARRVLFQMCRRRNAAQPEPFEHSPQHIWQKRFYDFNV